MHLKHVVSPAHPDQAVTPQHVDIVLKVRVHIALLLAPVEQRFRDCLAIEQLFNVKWRDTHKLVKSQHGENIKVRVAKNQQYRDMYSRPESAPIPFEHP